MKDSLLFQKPQIKMEEPLGDVNVVVEMKLLSQQSLYEMEILVLVAAYIEKKYQNNFQKTFPTKSLVI